VTPLEQDACLLEFQVALSGGWFGPAVAAPASSSRMLVFSVRNFVQANDIECINASFKGTEFNHGGSKKVL